MMSALEETRKLMEHEIGGHETDVEQLRQQLQEINTQLEHKYKRLDSCKVLLRMIEDRMNEESERQ